MSKNFHSVSRSTMKALKHGARYGIGPMHHSMWPPPPKRKKPATASKEAGAERPAAEGDTRDTGE